MSEVQTPPAGTPPAGTEAPAPSQKYAGKYETPEALENGLREIRGAMGLEPVPDDAKLIGTMYKDPDAAARDYVRMQRMMSQGKHKVGDPPLAIENPSTNGGQDDADYDVPDLIKKAGLDMAAVEKQYLEAGDLTAEQYAAIRKANPGLSKAAIKAIADGQAAKAQLRQHAQQAVVGEAQQIAGGKEQLDNLRQWAATNIPQERLDRLNKQVVADPTFYPEMIRLLRSEHADAVGAGRASPLINGSNPTITSKPLTGDDWRRVRDAAMNGDPAAIARIRAMKPVDRTF